MFNIDNSSAGIDRSTIQIDRKGNRPMAPRRLKTGQGFSLFDLKDVISDVTETLAAALNKQGVDVSTDQLFLQLQNLVQNVGSANGYVDSGYGGVLSASDNIPYSVAGDLLVIAYENYKNNDRKEAIKNLLAAMGEDDFGAIANGLFLMNKKANDLIADDTTDSDTDDSDTGNEEDNEDVQDDEDDADDNDTDDETGDDDLEDSDIEDALTAHDEENSGNEDEDEDEGNTDVENSDKDEDEEEGTENTSNVENKGDNAPKTENTDKPKPMGKVSSEMTASHTSKVLANRLSLDGSTLSRSKAMDFIKKNKNL